MVNAINNQPQNLQQFNLLNELVYEDNLLGKLTNYRKLGNKHEAHKQVVLSGYQKILNLCFKPLLLQHARKDMKVS